MEYKNIDQLIEKYFNGDSTLEDEHLIREYFSSSNKISDKHQQLKSLFEFYNEQSKATSNLKLDNIITESKPKAKTHKLIFMALAASIALLFSVFLFQENSTEEKVYAYINGQPVLDQQVAYNEAQKALLMISNNLNGGTKDLKHLVDFGKAEEMLRE